MFGESAVDQLRYQLEELSVEEGFLEASWDKHSSCCMVHLPRMVMRHIMVEHTIIPKLGRENINGSISGGIQSII